MIKTWLKRELPSQKFRAGFLGNNVKGHVLSYFPEGKAWPVRTSTKNLYAEVEHGHEIGSYVSAGRVISGTVLFGPAGMVAGAAARKNLTRVRVRIFDGGIQFAVLEESAKHTRKAELFAEAINASAEDIRRNGA